MCRVLGPEHVCQSSPGSQFLPRPIPLNRVVN